MTIDPNNLLKMLGLTARIGGGVSRLTPAGSGVAAPASTVQEGQFADLLAKARSGALSSNKPVSIASDAEDKIKLTDDQLAKISVAADQAEASGVRKALVMLDDQQVILDVASRTITGAATGGANGVVPDVDGVINLSTKAAQPAAPMLPVPAARIANQSLAKLLAQQSQAAA